MFLPAFVREARVFASLRRHRNFRLYATGQAISQMGSFIQSTALGWLLLQLTHSAAALGVLAVWMFGPTVAVGLAGGVIIDRFDRRRLLILSQSAYLALAAGLAALAWSGAITAWQLYVFAGLGGIVQIVDNPARLAFVSQMVGQADLPNAVALNAAIFNATRIIGPAVGGLLIAAVGPALCFTLNAASFVAVIVALALMRHCDRCRCCSRRSSSRGLASRSMLPPVTRSCSSPRPAICRGA